MADSHTKHGSKPQATKSLPLTREQRLRKDRRLGIVPVDIDVMAQHLITPKFGIKVEGLPIDAIYVTAFYAPTRYGLMMVYGHESFDKVPEGIELPTLQVVYKQYTVTDLPKNSPEATSADTLRRKNNTTIGGIE